MVSKIRRIDTTTAEDTRIFDYHGKESRVRVHNQGPGRVWIRPAVTYGYTEGIFLRHAEQHIFCVSSYFKQLFFELEDPATDTVLIVEEIEGGMPHDE